MENSVKSPGNCATCEVVTCSSMAVLLTPWQVIAATNRVDILDPALLRSGRLDRKIEFPSPNEEARARIMQIHSRKMNVQWVTRGFMPRSLSRPVDNI